MSTNTELLSVLDYLEREKGIDKDILIQAVETSLLSAALKSNEPIAKKKQLSVKIDRKTGAIRVLAELTVVKNTAEATPDEIRLTAAKKLNPNIKSGETIEVEVTTKDFGRIAAQTAKQTIIQKIREAERDLVFNEFKDRVGDITMGTVRRRERGNIIVDLGRTEAVLTSKEQCPEENYRIGDRIRTYVVSVKAGARGPEIVLSRTHVGLVKRLFELEVPEIAEGTVEIKGVVREAGYRTKIAVISSDPKVDPIGACVGMRGSRVKNIVRELENEKLDIIKWEPEIKNYVAHALNPAKLDNVFLNTEEKKIKVVVQEDQLSMAIGKRGQNVRLASKLLGWQIDIRKAGEEQEADPTTETAQTAETTQKDVDNVTDTPSAENTDLSSTAHTTEPELPTSQETPEETTKEIIETDTETPKRPQTKKPTTKEKDKEDTIPLEEEDDEGIEKMLPEELVAKLDISAEEAQALIAGRFYNLEKIAQSRLISIAKVEGIKKETAKKIRDKATEIVKQQEQSE